MMQDIQRSSRSGTPRGQLLSIQYLRGFAALSVLMTHALQWPLAELNTTLLKTGRLGVEVFFVISGFIITTIAGDGRFKPGEFLIRRAFRVIPAYWAATLLVTVLAVAIPSQFRTTFPTIEGLVKSLLFIPSLAPKAPLLVLGWTLNFEVFFYLIFTSLFFLRSETRTFVLFSLFATLVGVGQFASGLTHVEAIYTSPSLIGFCFGTILAQAYRHGFVTGMGGHLRRTMIAAPFALAFAYYIIDWDDAEQIALWKHLLMSFSALSIVWLGLNYEAVGRVPHIKLFKYLGDASYSIYLFHLFPVAAIWALSKRTFDVQQPFTYLTCATLAIATGLMFGLVCHHFIERPFLAAGPKRSRALPAT